MSKRHRMISFIFALTLMVIWLACFYVLFSSARLLAYHFTEETARSAQTVLADTLGSDASAARQLFSQFGGWSASEAEQVHSALAALSARKPALAYYAMDARGNLYADGGQAARPLGLTVGNAARRDGYALLYLADWNGYPECVAMVIEPPNASAHFLVRVEPLATFAKRLFDALPFPTAYAALYSEWGYLAGQSKDGDQDETLAGAMLAGARAYAQNRAEKSVQGGGCGSGYSTFIPLAQPSGWFIGARLTGSQIPPMASGMVIAFAISTAAWIVLLLFLFISAHKRKASAKKTEQGGHTDPLTGLITATSHERAVSDFLRKVNPKDHCFVALNITAFHRFNAMFGHALGDTLLRTVGRRLRENFACAARLGGDVFAFLAESSEYATADVKAQLLQAARDALGSQYLPFIGFTFGVYPLLPDTLTYREISDGALLAMKRAKGEPKTGEVIYDLAMLKDDRMRKFIEMNMLYALSKDEFEVYIQPKFGTVDVRCCGGEALVRWRSPQIGFMVPSQFITLFEENGFIAEIDFFVLNTVLTLLQEVQDSGAPLHPISVNQSRVTLSLPNYLERLQAQIGRFTIPLRYVELEITESVLTESNSRMASLVESLHRMGLSVAMDDFGKEYSSLSTLREMPFDVLKIDREFLTESDASQRGKKIISNILNMSRDLHLQTVCEGVETGTQLDFLRAAGCDAVQGFYLSKPIPMREFAQRYLYRQEAEGDSA